MSIWPPHKTTCFTVQQQVDRLQREAASLQELVSVLQQENERLMAANGQLHAAMVGVQREHMTECDALRARALELQEELHSAALQGGLTEGERSSEIEGMLNVIIYIYIYIWCMFYIITIHHIYIYESYWMKRYKLLLFVYNIPPILISSYGSAHCIV